MPPPFRRFLTTTLLVAAATLAPPAAIAAAVDAPPYDEAADAAAQVKQALTRARADSKHVLIVFGANWCGDCKMLDAEFRKPALKAVLDQHYVVVKVDVGRFNRNLDVVKAYGGVIKAGIPSIVVATQAGEPLLATAGGELADARKMGESGVLTFFQQLPARAGRKS